MHGEGTVLLDGHQSADRGERPPGAVTADGDALGINFKL